MSPISSRNSVPPSACRKRPADARCAPVNAPRSCPNSSLSIRSRGMAAMLRATNGRARRGLKSCSARATSSLPVPDSPSTSTVRLVFTTRATTRYTRCIAGDRPTIGKSSGEVSAADGAGTRVSAMARRTVATSSSRSNGFGKYSKAPRSPARRAVSIVDRALITMTGRSGRTFRTRGSKSRPLPDGIATSVMTRSPAPELIQDQSSPMSPVSRAAKPCRCRARRTTVRMAASSSPTRIVAVGDVCVFNALCPPARGSGPRPSRN